MSRGPIGFAEAVGGERVGGGEVLVEGLDVLHFEVGDGEAGEVLSEDVVEVLGLLFGVARGVEIAAVLGDVAEALFGDGAFERAVGLELEGGGAADGVEVGRENRKLDDLAVGAFHEDAVAALEVVLELAEGGLFPGGIEDEVSGDRSLR